MAGKNYLLNVGLDPASLADLQTLVAQAAPYQQDLLDALESNDRNKISSIIKQSNLGDAGDQIQGKLFSVADQLASPESGKKYQAIAEQVKDEPNATDEELQNKIGALKGLSKSGTVMDKATVERWIDQHVGRGEGSITTAKPLIADFVVQNRRLPDVTELRDLLNQTTDPLNPSRKLNGDALVGAGPLQNFLTNQNNKNFVATNLGGQPKDYTDDIKRIQDLLDTRTTENAKTADVQGFLTQGPADLAQSRAEFYQQQRESGTNYLRQRKAPQIVADLNTRGLAYGPDVQSEIVSAGANLQSSLESKIRDLEAQDNQFFADSAFRITQAKLTASEDQLRDQISFERAQARLKQQQNFNSKEADIQNEFDKNMLTQQEERDLAAQGDEINFEKSNSQSAAITDLTNDLGRSTGSIVTSKIVDDDKSGTTQKAPSTIG